MEHTMRLSRIVFLVPFVRVRLKNHERWADIIVAERRTKKSYTETAKTVSNAP